MPASNAAGSERPLRETSAVPVASSGVYSPGRIYPSLPSTSLDGNEYGDGTCTTPTATITRPAEVFTATAFPSAASLRINTTAPPSADLVEMGLQCNLLELLLAYMFPTDEYKIEEADLSRSLKEVWAQKEEDFKLVLDDLFAAHREALFGWIEELRVMRQLQLIWESHPVMDTSVLTLVSRVLALNRVRIALLRWKTIKANDGNQDLSLEDLLYRALGLMTNTEGSEQLFKKGVQTLRDTVFKAIRSEDLAILM